MWTEHRFISFDETPIFYRKLAGQDSAKAVLLMTHGMGEHGGRYRHVAEYFLGLGIESLTMDWRGFGQSGGIRESVRRFSDYEKDLGALHEFASRTHKNLPIFLLGHSFGGLVVASYAAGSPLKCRGLVLSSPLFGIAFPVPAWRHLLAVFASQVLPHVAQPNKVKAETLTHDKQIARQYDEDPRVLHGISARLYTEMVKQMQRHKEIASKLRCPVLMVQAGEDLVVSRQKALSFYDELKTEDKELEVYGGMYHEVLNELDRQRVLSRIGSWILKRI